MSGFTRLSPWIQDYIYRERWTTLREAQEHAITAVLDTPNHILIMSGTASGKTEAAFLPVLTHLTDYPSESIGVLYIGPLKALINDQFFRLEKMMSESDIPVQSWHGDIDGGRKRAFLRRAQGVLQITPESLEALLITRTTELSRLFRDLRFVIIDEVHAFIGSDRGRQIICQLERLSRYQPSPARRIGLSATLGAPDAAATWLSGGTDRKVTIIIPDASEPREVELAVEHYLRAPRKQAVADNPTPTDNNYDEMDDLSAPQDGEFSEAVLAPLPDTNFEPVDDESSALIEDMHRVVRQKRKTLIFTNSRSQAEEAIQNVRTLHHQADGKLESDDADGFFVHHGNISTALREQAEYEMRESERPACVAATITLELGIDLGSLDQVLQLSAPATVSSFVQRLGRSGRRGTPARMLFFTLQTIPPENAGLSQHIPWDLLQAIAIVQLYAEEKWIEPPHISRKPFSLLYHQTMSVLRSHTELEPDDLANWVLKLSPFAHITENEYRALLRHLLSIEHLQLMDEGKLIIGLKGEPIAHNYRFYATFQDEIVYQVRDGSREIGSIQSLPAIGDRFRLAGRSWQVLSIDAERRMLHVKQVKGKAEMYWLGGGAPIHSRVRQRMRQVLIEDHEYGYLFPRAVDRMHSARKLARESGLTRTSLLPIGGSHWMLFPWQGTRIMDTLRLLLARAGLMPRIDDSGVFFYITALDEQFVISQLTELMKKPPEPEKLIESIPTRALQMDKYDPYVPEDLLRAAYIADRLDLVGAYAWLETLMQRLSR
ncbi:MAG: DEAD/DEAH box helicase [Anaerolineae bacterium]|nr:DEAD/DEAH box helicase [Anaerolineae bacterium]